MCIRDRYKIFTRQLSSFVAGKGYVYVDQPLPINQALNRPRAKLGLDLSAWMAIVFVTVTVFLVGFRMLAILSFPMMAGDVYKRQALSRSAVNA